MPVSSALQQLGEDYAPDLIAQVFITDDLRRRPEGTEQGVADARGQISEALAQEPDAVLSKLVELALQFCDARSGGISLYVPGYDQFVWHYLSGELARFNGGSTPRHYSPCGVVLDTKSVVLVQTPERIYSWLSEAGISLPECLLVPLYDGGPEPIGTLWVVSSGPGHFTASHASCLTELADICCLGMQLSWAWEQIRGSPREEERLRHEIKRRIEQMKSTSARGGRKKDPAGPNC